jgi:NAD+ kinase
MNKEMTKFMFEGKMGVIGIITNIDKDTDLKYTGILVENILQRGGRACLFMDVPTIPQWVAEAGDAIILCTNEEDIFEQSELVVCVGGDGTFLKAARKAFHRDIPILGINLGNLGFLTEVDKKDIPNAVECLLQGKYSIEERMLLETTIVRAGQDNVCDFALNDVVISRGALSRILHLKSYFNDMFIDSFPGDGLIICTPTGSTAYSLSAGGPIVEPDNELMIMTPICPHILYSRSMITSSNRTIRVVVDEEYTSAAMVTIDGQKGFEIRGGDSIYIKRAAKTVKMVKISSKNFYNVLRTKIYDRGEKLRRNEV